MSCTLTVKAVFKSCYALLSVAVFKAVYSRVAQAVRAGCAGSSALGPARRWSQHGIRCRFVSSLSALPPPFFSPITNFLIDAGIQGVNLRTGSRRRDYRILQRFLCCFYGEALYFFPFSFQWNQEFTSFAQEPVPAVEGASHHLSTSVWIFLMLWFLILL